MIQNLIEKSLLHLVLEDEVVLEFMINFELIFMEEMVINYVGDYVYCFYDLNWQNSVQIMLYFG